VADEGMEPKGWAIEKIAELIIAGLLGRIADEYDPKIEKLEHQFREWVAEDNAYKADVLDYLSEILGNQEKILTLLTFEQQYQEEADEDFAEDEDGE